MTYTLWIIALTLMLALTLSAPVASAQGMPPIPNDAPDWLAIVGWIISVVVSIFVPSPLGGRKR